MQTLIIFLQSESPDIAAAVCGVFFVLVIVLFAIEAGKAATKKAKELEDAKNAYHGSLDRLKANPTSADQKQETLSLGRAYSHLTRNKKGVTIFDEVALSNDISAACAGAPNARSGDAGELDRSIEERLRKLSDLKTNGLIDSAEYASRRERILDEV